MEEEAVPTSHLCAEPPPSSKLSNLPRHLSTTQGGKSLKEPLKALSHSFVLRLRC